MTVFKRWFSNIDDPALPVSRIMSSGIWPALPLTGYWLLPVDSLHLSDSSFHVFTLFVLWTMVGIVVWSMGLLSSAAACKYRSKYFGLAGWTLVLLSLIELVRSNDLPASAPTAWTIWDVVMVGGLVSAGSLYLGFPRESILEGNDMGVYANHGIFIAQHGRLDLPYPWHGATSAALAEGLKGHSPHKSKFFGNHVFLGFQKKGPRLAAEFGHVWPMWLAQAYATAGPTGLFRLNGVFALLALVAFHGLCLTVVPTAVAVVATVFLALVPSQVWIARTTLSEVFTQFAICAGLLLLLQALKTDTPILALWAGVILSFAALIRCDSFLVLFLTITAQLGQSLIGLPGNQFDKVWFSFHLTAVPGFLLAIGYFICFSRPYFWKQFVYLRLIGLGTAIAFAALFFLPHLLGDKARNSHRFETVADLLGGGRYCSLSMPTGFGRTWYITGKLARPPASWRASQGGVFATGPWSLPFPGGSCGCGRRLVACSPSSKGLLSSVASALAHNRRRLRWAVPLRSV